MMRRRKTDPEGPNLEPPGWKNGWGFLGGNNRQRIFSFFIRLFPPRRGGTPSLLFYPHFFPPRNRGGEGDDWMIAWPHYFFIRSKKGRDWDPIRTISPILVSGLGWPGFFPLRVWLPQPVGDRTGRRGRVTPGGQERGKQSNDRQGICGILRDYWSILPND